MGSDKPERKRSREPLVRIAVAADDFDAQLMQDQLTVAGIRSLVQNTDMLAATGYVGVSAPFSRALYVLASDAERAAAVLAEAPAPPDSGNTEG